MPHKILPLSRTDGEQIGLALEAGVLLPTQKHCIENPEGTILVPCPDGDHFHDVYSQHCTLCEIRRHHPLCLNAGALLLSKHSPIRGAKMDGRTMLRHISGASKIKGMDTVVLYVHAPCGVAYGAKLDFFEVLRLLVEAKLRLRGQKKFAKLKIACFVHVAYQGPDFPNVRKRTYFVERKAAVAFLEKVGRPVRA